MVEQKYNRYEVKCTADCNTEQGEVMPGAFNYTTTVEEVDNETFIREDIDDELKQAIRQYEDEHPLAVGDIKFEYERID
jgi:predicted small metal-binding protein